MDNGSGLKSSDGTTSESTKAADGSKAATIALAPTTNAVVASVHRPSAGSISVVEVPQGAHLKLDFPSTEVKFSVLDVDLVMLFPDGGKIILPGYAFNLVGTDSGPTAFSDKTVSAQQLLAAVDDLRLINDNSPILSASAKPGQAQDAGKGKSDAEDAPPEAPPAPPPQPAAPTAKLNAVADFDKPPEPPVDRSLK
jgi:hypothetical protein